MGRRRVPVPYEGNNPVIRLWNRVGTFRALSVLVLLAGIVGGAMVADRQTQRHETTVPTAAAPRAVVDPQPEVADRTDVQRKADDAATAAAAQIDAAEDAARRSQPASRSENRSAPVGPVPASCQVYTGNRAIGCTVLLQVGFGLDQMPCLDKLWTKESNWRVEAYNRSSGATGIPQAVPGTKMAKFGADYKTNAAVQIRWGLDYIKNRYKTPCTAWGHSQSTGWY